MRKYCKLVGQEAQRRSVVVGETAITAETFAYWQDAEQRLRACQRCSEQDPGACAEQTLCIRHGQQPHWHQGRLVLRACRLWHEYLTIEALERSGVDARSARLKLGDLPAGYEEQLYELQEFLRDTLRGGRQWMVLRTENSRLCTHLAVGTIRELKVSYRRTGQREPRIWYADLVLLRDQLYGSFKRTEDADPLTELREYEIAVLDRVEPAEQPKWMREALNNLLYERWRARRCTILCTRGALVLGVDLVGAAPCPVLADVYSSVADAFEGAKVVQVGGHG